MHYLDIANEIPVAEAALAADEEARCRGISVLPAVGFGTAASDGLARYVADQIPEARRLEIAILAGTDGQAPGRWQADAGARGRWADPARRPAIARGSARDRADSTADRRPARSFRYLPATSW